MFKINNEDKHSGIFIVDLEHVFVFLLLVYWKDNQEVQFR